MALPTPLLPPARTAGRVDPSPQDLEMDLGPVTRPRPLARAGPGPLAPVVVVEDGAPLGAATAVGPRTLTLGRAPGLGLLLDDPSVSRIHAGLCVRGGRLEIQDYGSRNGTFLAGRRITWSEVEDGAELRVGECRLRVFLSPGTRDRHEHARTQLAQWRCGIDPLTRLPHGGVLRSRLAWGCARAQRQGSELCLYLLEVEVVTRAFAERLAKALPPGAEAFRHGSRRLAVLSERPLTDGAALAGAHPGLRGGAARASRVAYDPDRLLLAASSERAV